MLGRGVASFVAIFFSFIWIEMHVFLFRFSVALSITLFPFVHSQVQKNLIFIVTTISSEKKNKYKFIHFSMAVFVFCSVSHTYLHSQEWSCAMEKDEWEIAGLASSVLCISHFSLFIVHICSVYYLEQRNHDALAPRTPSYIFFHFDE